MSSPSPSAVGLSPEELERKRQELEQLRRRAAELEADLAQAPAGFRPRTFYTAYYATTGFMLGMIAAATSLLFNVVGSLIWSQLSGQPQHPLRLIQVYLTFPLGESALQIETGLTLAIGCCLYLGTGMLYGMAFQIMLARMAQQSFVMRLGAASALALAIWIVNFYGLLSWLQPLLIGGNWIVELVPWWVAALTHLVFGWTMLLVSPWGMYSPYRLPTERS